MSNMKQKAEKSKTKTKTVASSKKTVAAPKTTKRHISQVPARNKLTVPVGNGVDVNSRKRTRVNAKIEQEDGAPKSKKVLKTTVKKRELIKLDDNDDKNVETVIEYEEVAPKSMKPVKTEEIIIVHRVDVKLKKGLLEVPRLPTKSGVLFVIGDNDVGQLGLGEAVELKKRPAEFNFPNKFVDVAAGGMHSVCVTDKGDVYTFGCNDEGALGRVTEDEGSEHIPRKVDIPEVVVRVSAGDSHSAALTENGHVYIWGNFRSCDGPMGLTAHGMKQLAPVRILRNTTVISISSGSEHLVCLSNDGFLYTCGCGEAGQLGRVSDRTCKDGGRKGKATLLEPDSVHIAISGRPLLLDAVWTGSYTTFTRAVKTGLVYAFGLNNCSQLGILGSSDKSVEFRAKQLLSFNSQSWQRISGGQHHTLALDTKGQVYSLGRKEYGRLGLGEDCEDQSEPVLIPKLQSEKCIDISSGNIVSFAVTDKGAVYSWGMGTNYQLGHGNDEDCHVPKVIEGDLLNSWHAFKVSGGGQHTLILANRKGATEKKSNVKE